MPRSMLFPLTAVFIAAACMAAAGQESEQSPGYEPTQEERPGPELLRAPATLGLLPLSGNLPAVLSAQPQPYLVTTDIYVPSGKTVRIEPGAVLLFRNFTGLHVEGRLIAHGQRDRRIIFTSENNRQYNPSAELLPNAYDWNGVFIHESGLGSDLTSCDIGYSVYGVNALTRFIKLQDVVFHDNGRADLTIEGVKTSLRPNEPFSYAASLEDARKAGVPVNILIDPLARRRNMIRYGGIGVFFAGAAFAAWCGNAWSVDNNRLKALKDVTVRDENSSIVKNTSADFEAALSDRNRNEALTIVGAGVALLGCAGFAWSFTF